MLIILRQHTKHVNFKLGVQYPLRKEDTEIIHMTRCDPNFNQRMKSHGKVQNMPKCGMFKIHNSIIDFKFQRGNRIHVIMAQPSYD